MPGGFYIEGKAEKIDITQLVEMCSKQLLPIDFWSEPQEELQVDGAGITVSLPVVTVDSLLSGAIVARTVAMFKFRMVENTDTSTNNLDGDTLPGISQVIQMRDGSSGIWTDAIYFVDGQFSLEGETREGGDVCIGSINIAGTGKVDGNGVYEFRWLLAKAISDFLNFNDIQVGIRVWYRSDS
jgi:hypothetical protein